VGNIKIKDKIFKRKFRKSKDKWIVRIEYLDELTGKTKYIERQTDRKGDAAYLRNKLINDVRKYHGQMQTGERMNFNQLAVFARKLFINLPRSRRGKKFPAFALLLQ
jgi:hypothetical protein